MEQQLRDGRSTRSTRFFLAILEMFLNSAVTTFALRTPLGGTPTDATDTARQFLQVFLFNTYTWA